MNEFFMIDDRKIKINEGKRRIGKDEMNLIELPFTLLTKRNPKGLKTIERTWISKGVNGKEEEFYKIITGSDKWGLPTFIGEELYLACMELSYRQGFENRTVYTTQYELINLMGWPDDGRSYERLIKAFNQLGGLWITTNAFWDNEEKEYKKIGFGIIDDYIFSGSERRGKRGKYKQTQLPVGNFNWNEKFFEHSIKKGNIKTLDIALYFSLKSYISKRLYRFADKKLYNQRSFELDLFRLAFEKLEMVGKIYKYPSNIIKNLKPSIIELKSRNIAQIEIKSSSTPSGYKVCFSPITKPQIAVPEQAPNIQIIPKNSEKSPKDTTKAANLVKYFHSYIDPNIENYTPSDKEIRQANALRAEYGEEKAKHIVEYALKKAKETNFDMQFFGAVMNYASKAMGKFNQKAAHAKEKDERKLEIDYDFYRMEQSEQYKKTLPENKLKKLSARYEEIFLKDHPFYQTFSEEKKANSIIYQDTLKSFFNDWLIKQGKVEILSLEQWKAQATVINNKVKAANAM